MVESGGDSITQEILVSNGGDFLPSSDDLDSTSTVFPLLSAVEGQPTFFSSKDTLRKAHHEVEIARLTQPDAGKYLERIFFKLEESWSTPLYFQQVSLKYAIAIPVTGEMVWADVFELWNDLTEMPFILGNSSLSDWLFARLYPGKPNYSPPPDGQKTLSFAQLFDDVYQAFSRHLHYEYWAACYQVTHLQTLPQEIPPIANVEEFFDVLRLIGNRPISPDLPHETGAVITQKLSHFYFEQIAGVMAFALADIMHAQRNNPDEAVVRRTELIEIIEAKLTTYSPGISNQKLLDTFIEIICPPV